MLADPISANADYFKQYSNLYFCRLNQAKKNLTQLEALAKVSDICNHSGQQVHVIGTVFQDKKVHDYSKVEELEYLDTYYLEDEYSRIALNRNNIVLISGSVVGIRGIVDDDVLVVEEVVYPYMPSDIERVKSVKFDQPWILLISGLELEHLDNAIQLDTLYHLLIGNNKSFPKDVLEQISTIAIVGNSFHKLTENSISMMNNFIGNISKYHKVLLVPSNSDPTSVSWPNKAIPKQLFPKATSSVTSVENPARFKVNDFEVIFESGDALNNIYAILNKNNTSVTKDEIAQLLIKCRHLAPCCPDTLPCIPSFDSDPLYLTNIPDLLIIGNQDKASLQQIGSCTIVSIPSFTESGSVVLYNMEKKALKTISINKSF